VSHCYCCTRVHSYQRSCSLQASALLMASSVAPVSSHAPLEVRACVCVCVVILYRPALGQRTYRLNAEEEEF
jgi:hypothetical protein